MYERGTKDLVPEKLERFLRTTAVRDGIGEASVAAVVITKAGLVVRENKLPSRAVNGDGIGEALSALLDDMDMDARGARYVGYCDCGAARQYNFCINAEPARIRGSFRKISIENAIGMLGRCEARSVVAALRNKRI